MDAEQILREKIIHEIDMDLLREIQKVCNFDLSKEIALAEKKFNNKVERVIHDITNKTAHETNNL
jgi:hypothetical protein